MADVPDLHLIVAEMRRLAEIAKNNSAEGSQDERQAWTGMAQKLKELSVLTSAPAPASGGVDAVAVLSTLNRMVTDYLTPDTYKARFPESNIPWHSDFPMPDKHHSEAGAHQVNLRRDQAFIRDVIHLQDNPSGIKPREPASLSPAATPVSEAEPAVLRGDTKEIVDRLRAVNGSTRRLCLDAAMLVEHLAKPASSPAGGDVREALDWLAGFNAYRAGPCAQDVRTAFISGWMHRAEQEAEHG